MLRELTCAQAAALQEYRALTAYLVGTHSRLLDGVEIGRLCAHVFDENCPICNLRVLLRDLGDHIREFNAEFDRTLLRRDEGEE